MRRPTLLFALATLSLPGAFAAEAGPEDLLPFKRDLMGALSAGLADSTVAAVESCRLVAPGLPEAHASRGFDVGRASDRLRNPDNVAPAWVAPVLAGMLDGTIPAEPRAVTLEDGRGGWVEPIRVAPLCLQCHGSEIAPDVEAALDAGYPDDRARGYAAGDLRGVFWIVPRPEETPPLL